MAIFGVIVALILLGFAISNEYIRRHRTLHIVNGFTQKATIEVRGASSVQAGRGLTELVLPEGRHHASITGPVRQEVDFEIRSGYFNRWFSDPAWVLNVGGAAVLLFTDVVYSRNPRPAAISFHFGEAFQHFPEVTNPFQPLPDSLRMKEHEERKLTHLDIFNGEPADVFQYFRGQNQTEQALHFAEWRLGIQPDDEVVLRSYVLAADALKQSDRAEKFLTFGLTNRPVRIEWHRAYQNLHKDRRRDARLAVEYDAMLRAEPTNSALLYLRGRISGDHAEGRRYFERSRETDQRNPYPLYALGYDRMAVADFAGAKTLLARAVELSPKDTTFIYFLETARLALGESAGVEQELREGVKREPLQPGLALRLSNTLVAQGKNAEAQQVIAGFERAASAQYREAARDMNNALHRHLLYATGDFAALEKHAAGDSSPGGRQSLFEAQIEQGRMEEAVKIQPMDGSEEEKPFQFLTVAVGWRHVGKTEEAEEWLARALKSLENGNDDYARAATLLRHPTEPTRAELDDVILSLRWKAILCGALAQKHASNRAELAAAARRLNVERVFPYHLVQRVTAEAR